MYYTKLFIFQGIILLELNLNLKKKNTTESHNVSLADVELRDPPASLSAEHGDCRHVIPCQAKSIVQGNLMVLLPPPLQPILPACVTTTGDNFLKSVHRQEMGGAGYGGGAGL